MDISGYTIRGKVVLQKHHGDGYRVAKSIRPWIEVISTPLGLMIGRWKDNHAYRYCVKCEGENFTEWYEVQREFPLIPREKLV